MPAELSIALDARNLAKFRTLLSANKRIAAQSLTFTAERARDAWRVENSRVFHMRGDGINKAIGVRMATLGNLNARVGSIDKFMGRHIIGVDEPKESDGTGLFVPIQPIAQQPTHTGIRSRLKAMMRTKSKPFWQHGELLRRIGPNLIVLGVMRKSVKIKPRLDALGIVDRAVQVHYPTVYARLLTKWSKTA